MKPYRARRHDTPGRFVVYDCEAVDWFTVVCCAAVNSDGESIVARNLSELFSEAIAKGWVDGHTPWFAHYGGIYDNLLAIRDLLPRGWQITRGVYNSSFGLWSVDLERDGIKLCLRDSSRLLPGALKGIGKAIGVEKLDVDRRKIQKLAWNQVSEYCKRDCDIVRLAIQKLHDYCPEAGDTLPSRTTKAFRRLVPKNVWGWTRAQDEVAHRAYFGGRVEVFRRYQKNTSVYDINSCYPWAMCQPLPTEYLGVSDRWNGGEGIVEATIVVPPCMYPVLPVVPQNGALAGRVVFPTGRFRGAWCAPELRRAVEQGARIIRVHAFYKYACEPWMMDMVRGWYGARLEAKQNGDAFSEYMFKIMLNASYGKFVEDDEHEMWTQDQEEYLSAPENNTMHEVRTTDNRLLAVYGVLKSEVGAFRHSVAGAYITALGRVRLHEGLSRVGAAYCDTDCVHCPEGLRPSPISETGLGAYKHEGTWDESFYVAPKVYALFGGKEASVRAKGFGRMEKRRSGESLEHYEDRMRRFWKRLVSGKPLKHVSTSSFVDMISRGRLEPVRVGRKRRLHLERVDKRCFDATGESRSWDFAELSEL